MCRFANHLMLFLNIVSLVKLVCLLQASAGEPAMIGPERQTVLCFEMYLVDCDQKKTTVQEGQIEFML